MVPSLQWYQSSKCEMVLLSVTIKTMIKTFFSHQNETTLIIAVLLATHSRATFPCTLLLDQDGSSVSLECSIADFLLGVVREANVQTFPD